MGIVWWGTPMVQPPQRLQCHGIAMAECLERHNTPRWILCSCCWLQLLLIQISELVSFHYRALLFCNTAKGARSRRLQVPLSRLLRSCEMTFKSRGVDMLPIDPR